MTLATTATTESANLRGILALLAGMAILTLNDVTVKLASTNLPTGQLIFLRGGLATVLILIICLAMRRGAAIRGAFTAPVLSRAAANLGATICYLTALFNMPIANVSAIAQAVPLLLTALAAIFLKEAVGWRRWLAIGIGFVGMLIIVRPTGDGFNVFAVFALIAIVFTSVRDLLTRAVKPHVPSIVVTLATSSVVTIGGATMGLFETWSMPEPREAALIAASGACLVGGYHFTIVAMRAGEVAVIAPFRFSIIVWAMLAGYLVWGEIPDAYTFAGIALIVATGVYTFHREAIRARLHRTPPIAAETRREI